MEDAAEPFLTSSNELDCFLFTGDVQEDTLPIERIAVDIENQIGIFLDPYGAAIAFDKPIFFKKPGSRSFGNFTGCQNFVPIIWMQEICPKVLIGIPFICRVTGQI